MPRFHQTSKASTSEDRSLHRKKDTNERHHRSSKDRERSRSRSASRSPSRSRSPSPVVKHKSKHHNRSSSSKVKGRKIEKKKHSKGHRHSSSKDEKKKRRRSRTSSLESHLMKEQKIPSAERRPKLFLKTGSVAKLIRCFADQHAMNAMSFNSSDSKAFKSIEDGTTEEEIKASSKERNDLIRKYRLKIRTDAIQYTHESLEEFLKRSIKKALKNLKLNSRGRRTTLSWTDLLCALCNDDHLKMILPEWIDEQEHQWDKATELILKEEQIRKKLKPTTNAIQSAKDKLEHLIRLEQIGKEKEAEAKKKASRKETVQSDSESEPEQEKRTVVKFSSKKDNNNNKKKKNEQQEEDKDNDEVMSESD